VANTPGYARGVGTGTGFDAGRQKIGAAIGVGGGVSMGSRFNTFETSGGFPFMRLAPNLAGYPYQLVSHTGRYTSQMNIELKNRLPDIRQVLGI
jgi:hypothetical protein